MSDPTRKAASAPVEVKLAWQDSDIGLQFIDEAYIQWMNDRFYLTFGQIDLPAGAWGDNVAPATLNLRPVARLVATKETAIKIRDLMNRLLSESKA